MSQQPVLHILDRRDLDHLYRGEWIARKIVDIPAFDSTRAWRNWQADEDQIEKLEECEREFGIQRKLLSALVKARLYGGAAIVLGVNQGTFQDELDVERVKKGDLKFVHVVERWMIAAGPVVKDITSPWFGQPSYYMRSNIPTPPPLGNVEPPESLARVLKEQEGGQFFIHPSRVVRLIGLDYPDIEMAPDAWGDSVLQPVMDAIRAAGLVNSSVSAMISEAKLDVIKIPGLQNLMSTTEGSQLLINRFSNANAAKSVVNTLMVDTTEEWDRKELRLTGMDKVMQMYLLICAGAADIPSTRLLGREPAGQNATGESDIRNYYDRLAADQKVRLTPALHILDEVLIRHTFGSRDPDIHSEWNPLWQMDDEQKAKIEYQKAQAYEIDVKAGLIEPDVLKAARENALIESAFLYPGIEAAIDEAEENAPDPEDVDERSLFEQLGVTPQPGQPQQPQGQLPPPGGQQGGGSEFGKGFQSKFGDVWSHEAQVAGGIASGTARAGPETGSGRARRA